jgi:hypothetical protein
MEHSAPRIEMMTVSLELISAQLQRVLDGQTEIRSEQREMRRELGELRAQVGYHRDEMTVLTGLVMRYAGEHVAWGNLQQQLAKLTARVEALEHRET